MRRRSSNRDTSTRAVVVAALLGSACTHEVERFPAYSGPQTVGSIGSGPVGDDGNDEDDSSSDDDGSSTDDDEGMPADDGNTGGGPGPSTTANDPTGAPEAETGGGDPVLDACLEIAATECETCACNLCLDPLYACQQDVGCVAMRDCAQQTGCEGVDCLEPCGAVIDMHGGAFGASGALAIALSDCLSASCPTCF